MTLDMDEGSMLPKMVLFDWDGTLADTFQFIEAAHNHVLEALGLPARESGWFYYYFGKPPEYIYLSVYGDKGDEARPLFIEFVRANSDTAVRPLPDVVPMLTWLREQGVQMGVVTNKRSDLVVQEIESFGWSDYFVTVVGAGDAAENKPSAAPLMLALEKVGYDGDIKDVWFVGDTVTDLECAKQAGAPSVFVMQPDMSVAETEIINSYETLFNIDDHRHFLTILRDLV